MPEDRRLWEAAGYEFISGIRAKWGISEGMLKALLEETDDDYALTLRLRELIERGIVTEDQATLIAEYVMYRWGIAEEALKIDLPAGTSAYDVQRRVIASGQAISPASAERLRKGVEMEREEAREATRWKEWPLEKGEHRIELPEGEAEVQRLREIAEARAGGVDIQAAEKAGSAYLKAAIAQKEAAAPRVAPGGEGFILGAEGGEPMPPYIPYRPYEPPEKAEVAGPWRWRDWFEQKYPSIVREFRAEPTRTEATWADWLARGKKREYEEWHGRGAYQRGEFPSRYAPRIKTIKF